MNNFFALLLVLALGTVVHAGEKQSHKVSGKFVASESGEIKSEKYMLTGSLQSIPSLNAHEIKVPVLQPQKYKVKVGDHLNVKNED